MDCIEKKKQQVPGISQTADSGFRGRNPYLDSRESVNCVMQGAQKQQGKPAPSVVPTTCVVGGESCDEINTPKTPEKKALTVSSVAYIIARVASLRNAQATKEPIDDGVCNMPSDLKQNPGRC